MENEKTSFEDMVVKKNDTNLNYILRSENTILSPHIAGWTKESKIKISNLIIEKIISLK
jgi:D-3-phosphoglycerate dehydrogenase